MKRVFRETAILRETGEDVTHLIEIAREVCYKNMKKNGNTAYIDKENKNTDNKKDRVS